MISIIICTRNSSLFQNVVQSLTKTIGVPFEVIPIQNADGKYGICEAYNLGASKSQFDILCFTHEDILFHTQNWGQKILKIFNLDEKIGLIGVIGSAFQPDAPASWWDTGLDSIRQRILQRYPEETKEIIHNPENQLLADVVTIDGLWFCCRRKVWEETQFDARTFSGFHFYDLDFSTAVFQKYRVCVTFEILIEHFSLGNLDNIWRENVIRYHQKWRKKLPLLAQNLPEEKRRKHTFRITRNFTTRLIENQFPKAVILKYALRSILLNPKDRQNHWFMVWLFEAYFPQLYRLVRRIFRMLR